MAFKRISIYFGIKEGKNGYLNIIDHAIAKDNDNEIEKHLKEGWEIVSAVPITSSYCSKTILKNSDFNKYGEDTGKGNFEHFITYPYTQSIQVLLVKK